MSSPGAGARVSAAAVGGRGGPPQLRDPAAPLSCASVDALRHEMELLIRDATLFRAQKEEYDIKISDQLEDLVVLQKNFAELDRGFNAARARFEGEVAQLRREIDATSGPVKQPVEPSPGGPSELGPPPLLTGHKKRNPSSTNGGSVTVDDGHLQKRPRTAADWQSAGPPPHGTPLRAGGIHADEESHPQ
ncbi:hypothetical protein HK405_009781, partial [Cladochytrium tenue]